MFGFDRFENVVEKAKNGLRELGYRPRTLRAAPLTLAELLLSVRSPRIEDVTDEAMIVLRERCTEIAAEKTVFALSRWFALKGIIEEPLRRRKLRSTLLEEAPDHILRNVPPEWARLARYWYETSTLSPACRLRHLYRLLCVGRWLRERHPDLDGPEQWSRMIAVEAVTMLANQRSGEWSHLPQSLIINAGQTMAAPTRILGIASLRTFFRSGTRILYI